jgi:hypothetical protein
MSSRYKWTDECANACSDLGIDVREGEIDRSAGESVIERAEGTSTTADGSPALDQVHIEAVVDLIPNMSTWQAQMGFSTVTKDGGKITSLNADGVVLQKGGEDQSPSSEPYKDVWGSTTYNTQKLTGELAFVREHYRQAREAGIPLPDFLLMRIAKLLANNLGDLNMNGDTSLAATSRRNKLLRANQGILALLAASGQHNLYPTTATGKAFDPGAFDATYYELPDEYKHDGNLTWFYPVPINMAWSTWVRNVNPANVVSGVGGSQGSPLGDRQLQQQMGPPIYGIAPLLVPQMPSNQAGSIGTVAPTAVADVGGNAVATITTIASATLNGRRVKIRYKPTGQEQTLVVVYGGGLNKITAVGDMGAGAVDTAAANYEVSLADLSSMILTVPGNFHVVLYDDIRAYVTFDQRRERFLFTIHFEHDIVCHSYDAVVLQSGIITPQPGFNA